MSPYPIFIHLHLHHPHLLKSRLFDTQMSKLHRYVDAKKTISNLKYQERNFVSQSPKCASFLANLLSVHCTTNNRVLNVQEKPGIILDHSFSSPLTYNPSLSPVNNHISSTYSEFVFIHFHYHHPSSAVHPSSSLLTGNSLTSSLTGSQLPSS